MKKTPAMNMGGQQSPGPASNGVTASDLSETAGDMPDAGALLAERDLLQRSLDAMQADQADALASVRRAQDLAAQTRRLEDALEQSRMRVAEVEGRCRDLELQVEALSAGRDESIRRETALHAELAHARIAFQQRIEQLAQSLAGLQRPHQRGAPEQAADDP